MVHSWIRENYIEILGSVTGLIYLYLSIRKIIWLWPVGIISSLLYISVFFNAKFYADMSLQVYYFFISIYGWYYWLKERGRDERKEITIISSSLKELLLFIGVTIIFTFLIGYGLDNYTDSPLPYWDAFTTSGSIVATWMLARKYLEQWLFWIVVDFVSMGTYIYKELYPTVLLFLAYTLMAFIGFFNWKKDVKTLTADDNGRSHRS